MIKVQLTLPMAKICKIPPKSTFIICPFSPHLLTLPLLPLPHVHFFRRGNPHPDRGQPPTGEALHIHNWAPLYLSLSFLLTQNTIHPHSPTNSCKWHQVDAKCSKQSSGLVGWSAMTVPQHNLFYLTPANAPEQTGGHSGAQRTHAAPSFNNRPNQRRQKTVLHQDARMHLVLFTTLVQSSWHCVIFQIEYLYRVKNLTGLTKCFICAATPECGCC